MKLEKYKIKTQIVKCGENNKQVNVTVRYALVNDGNCLNKKAVAPKRCYMFTYII